MRKSKEVCLTARPEYGSMKSAHTSADDNLAHISFALAMNCTYIEKQRGHDFNDTTNMLHELYMTYIE